MNYREIRFVIEDELTQFYVLIEALGDCPIGVQGWHHKTFPASKPADDIWKEISDAVLWPLDAPPERSHSTSQRLEAELKHARADNERLKAENEKLGESVTRLLAERDSLSAELAELRTAP